MGQYHGIVYMLIFIVSQTCIVQLMKLMKMPNVFLYSRIRDCVSCLYGQSARESSTMLSHARSHDTQYVAIDNKFCLLSTDIEAVRGLNSTRGKKLKRCS